MQIGARIELLDLQADDTFKGDFLNGLIENAISSKKAGRGERTWLD
jgi:hypothetical protein